jgi:hypothetical protein
MNNGAIRLTLLIGPTIALPAPAPLADALQSVEVTHDDAQRSGFQITFQSGRDGMFGLADYPLLRSPLLRPFNRVVLIVTMGALPRVLMDGIITHQQFDPGRQPGVASVTVTGEDVSLMMDQEEKTAEHPAQNEAMIAAKIILNYARFGMVPMVIPPISVDLPLPIERTPVQRGSDRSYLDQMAQRYGYVFYVTPGPAPLTNVAYWGPPIRVGIPQRALSTDLGAETNVESLNFQHNAQEPTLVEGEVQDRRTNQKMPVRSFASTRVPLASQPDWLVQRMNLRRVQLQSSGMSVTEAYARAQGMTDASTDTVTAEGELDALRYGDLLRARGVVGLRGAGYSHDGMYYVKRVTHTISRGSYKQRFTLTREGLGALLPVVRP